MHLPLSILRVLFLALSHPLLAGESALTTTYQPLDTLGSGKIIISPVACHDWYSHGSMTTAVGLISARNVPPTNNPKEATEDLNLASVCKIRFSTSDLGDPRAAFELTMDVTEFAIPAPQYDGVPREDILRLPRMPPPLPSGKAAQNASDLHRLRGKPNVDRRNRPILQLPRSHQALLHSGPRLAASGRRSSQSA